MEKETQSLLSINEELKKKNSELEDMKPKIEEK